jgi:hypothetical protein
MRAVATGKNAHTPEDIELANRYADASAEALARYDRQNHPVRADALPPSMADRSNRCWRSVCALYAVRD